MPSGLQGVFQADQEVKSLLMQPSGAGAGEARLAPRQGRRATHGLTFTGARWLHPLDPAPSVLLLGAMCWAVREPATPRLGGRDKGHLPG